MKQTCYFQQAMLIVFLPVINGDHHVIGNMMNLLLNLTEHRPLIHPLYPQIRNYDSKAKYDFIIVGSGPSGSVLANRLSEIPEWNVLLLEAGEEANHLTEIPFFSGFFRGTKYDWGYKAEQQDGFCRGELFPS
nr:glucose dehydrogenase [FAD, quinone]-like [Leptinotarsa decemlineata]